MATFRLSLASRLLTPALLLSMLAPAALAQGTVPTFQHRVGTATYTLVGQNPAHGGVTTIPTLLVPVKLAFESRKSEAGTPFSLDADADLGKILHSPVFSRFAFPQGGVTQYGDAMLRASFPQASGWHTLLGQPGIKPISITVPSADGYVLTSKQSGTAIGVVDLFFLQKELFRQIPHQPGKLVIAVTRDTTFYAPRPTLCCSWGTHGVDTATGNSFVVATYLDHAPGIVTDRDVQPLTQQLAEFLNDPLHNPLLDNPGAKAPGNTVPPWTRPEGYSDDLSHCVTTIATARYLLEPTDTNLIDQFPASTAYLANSGGTAYHLDNVALLAWYTRESNPTYSFPDARALPTAAKSCSALPAASAAHPVPEAAAQYGHALIGYWQSHGRGSRAMRLRNVPSQWDIVIVSNAFHPDRSPAGTMRFGIPAGTSAAQLKADIAYLQHRGKKVLLCLGASRPIFVLDSASSENNFVDSVAGIVSTYGFNGIDIDLEIPTMMLQPGDTDFRHPTTPSIVHLIHGLRALRQKAGPGFMISLVPEGPQVPAGYVSYGGGFGSYLPIAYGIRDVLSFIDVQNYNSPPLEGLDGEIYQLGTVGYYASQNELLIHGFDVDQNPALHFPGIPADKVAVGFITGASVSVIRQSLDYLVTGQRPNHTRYRLQDPAGYPHLLGAMFWSINGDQSDHYRYSNVIGPQLHQFTTSHTH